jgi:hypothetical protein
MAENEPERKAIDELSVGEHVDRIRASRLGGVYDMPPSDAQREADRAAAIKDGTYDHAQDRHPAEMTVDELLKRQQSWGRR